MAAQSRPDPFQPTVNPGEHEYENPAMLREVSYNLISLAENFSIWLVISSCFIVLQVLDGKLSMSSNVQAWSAPKQRIPVDKMQLEDDDSDGDYMDGEYDQARLIP